MRRFYVIDTKNFSVVLAGNENEIIDFAKKEIFNSNGKHYINDGKCYLFIEEIGKESVHAEDAFTVSDSGEITLN